MTKKHNKTDFKRILEIEELKDQLKEKEIHDEKVARKVKEIVVG